MQYICLRDCYVGEVFWARGTVCELPDDLDKSPKNFQLMEGGSAPESTTEILVRTRTLLAGEYLCSKCSKIHREDSRIGKRHLMYREGVGDANTGR